MTCTVREISDETRVFETGVSFSTERRDQRAAFRPLSAHWNGHWRRNPIGVEDE